MKRHLNLSFFGLMICLTPMSAHAGADGSYDNEPSVLENSFDSAMNSASSLAGAPRSGRALESDDPRRFDPPSAFERHYRKHVNQPAIPSGSSRPINIRYSAPPPIAPAPVRVYHAPAKHNPASTVPHITYGSAPQVSYKAAPQVSYKAEPQISFEAEPQISYEPTTQISYEPTTQISYEPNPNSTYETKRIIRSNRRELTPAEQRTIFNQKVLY